MKGTKKYLLFAIALIFLLSGCSIGEYKNVMETGQKAFEIGNYNLAIEYFTKATEIKPNDIEAQQKLAKARDMKFTSAIKQGNAAYTEKNYTEALKFYNEAATINNTDEALVAIIETSKALSKKQEELEEYIAWLEPIVQKNFSVSNEWKSSMDQLTVGTLTVDEFRVKIENLLPVVNDISREGETKSFELTGEIGNVHSAYVRELNKNHRAVLDIIIAAKSKITDEEGIVQKVSISEILKAGEGLSNIQEQQAAHIRALKTFAANNQLKFDFKLSAK